MISIVIPAYNEAKYIEKTLKQIPKNVEVIVVCNGCTDNTQEIAKKYAKTYVIKEKNVSLARNYGGEKAKGDKIIFLDADTLINNKLLERINKIDHRNFFGTCRVMPDNKKISHLIYCKIKNIVGILGIHNSSGIIFCSKDIFKKVKFNEKIVRHENQEFSKKAKRYGRRYFLNSVVITSMRRYDKLGYANVLIQTLKYLFSRKKEYLSVR